MRHIIRRHIGDAKLSIGGEEIDVKNVVMTSEEVEPITIMGAPCRVTQVTLCKHELGDGQAGGRLGSED